MISIDLPSYFRRIQFRHASTPTLATLRSIVALHTAAIPFENLDPFAGRPVALDLESLERKLVHERRGGYCFEHNLLLRDVLLQLGYTVSGLAARVRWNAPDDIVTARTHMLLRVELDDDTHLVDVGFGGLTLTGVLRLNEACEQSTPHEPFRLVASTDDFLMQASIKGEWRSLYRFDLQLQYPVDYEATNWYLSTSPDSRFTRNLIAARALPDRRYTLLNTEFTTHYLAGRSERKTLSDVDSLRDALERHFGIAVPRIPEMDAALRRIVGNS